MSEHNSIFSEHVLQKKKNHFKLTHFTLFLILMLIRNRRTFLAILNPDLLAWTGA